MHPELQMNIERWQKRVERSLEHWLPEESIQPANLHKAMRYSALAKGKRIRPILVYATGLALEVDESHLDAPACAVELIHAYSLVHDDLPSMDDDDLRRGLPTCHKVFGDGMAILAGDALQTLAFHVLSHANPSLAPEQRLNMVYQLALSAGSRGMAGGQAIDIAAVGQELNRIELENMHIHKTGALIRASIQMAISCAGKVEKEIQHGLDHYAKCIGLAFQIRDDILDVEGETDIIGKTSGNDSALNKVTYPSIMGLSEAKQTAQDLHDAAMESIAMLGTKADSLRQLSEYIVQRDR